MQHTTTHLTQKIARLVALVVALGTGVGQGPASAESWLGGDFAKGVWARLSGHASADDAFELRNPPSMEPATNHFLVTADRQYLVGPSDGESVPFAVALDRAWPSSDSWGKDTPTWWSEVMPVSAGIQEEQILPLPGIAEESSSDSAGLETWRDPIPTMHPSYPDDYAPFAPLRAKGFKTAFHKVVSDYRNFYSCESLVGLTAVFGAGALMANTGFDQTMQNAWQTSVTPSGFGHFVAGTKFLGEGRYELPVWGAAAVTGMLLENSVFGDVVGEWGSRSLRMFTVGAPPLYVLQMATGASRPADGQGSQWHMLNDNNGVSGHAFIGAIPFLAAADMVENPWAKGGLYVCSTFCGLSRIDANAHYPSQVFLGWSLAFASSMAVNGTELEYRGVYVKAVPLAVANGSGIAMEARW